jgi:prepilin-type N-terminal cleavage/methylation domain-containing protein
MTLNGSFRTRAGRRGFTLVEITLATALLTALSVILLKVSIQISSMQSWAAMQSLTDAYLSRETALASRLPFGDLVSAESPWPPYPESSETEVAIGRYPGGREIRVSLVRFREPDPNNLDLSGGSGTLLTNPARTEAWKARSVISYRIAGRDYHKARTILRVR